MERELFSDFQRWLRVIGQRRRNKIFTHADTCIAAVHV